MENKGFTLVEIVVTVAILLAAAAISIPSVITMNNNNKEKQKKRVEQIVIDAKDSYCNFNECSGEIELSTLINNDLLDEEDIEEYINLGCTIDASATKLAPSCIKN